MIELLQRLADTERGEPVLGDRTGKLLEQDVETSDVFSKAAIVGVVLALAIDLAVRNRPSAAMLGLVNGWAALLAALLLSLRARGWPPGIGARRSADWPACISRTSSKS